MPRALRSLTNFRRQIADKSVPLTVEDERRLAAIMRTGGDAAEAARDELVTRSLRLVWRHAARATADQALMFDLISAGVIGLLKAADKFDPTRGVRFASQATAWVHSEIHTVLFQMDRPVHLARHQHHKIRQMQRAAVAFQAREGRAPTDAELSKASGYAVGLVRALRIFGEVQPAEMSVGFEVEHEGTSRGDAVNGMIERPLPDCPTGLEQIEEDEARDEAKARVAELLQRTMLPEFERDCVAWVYGLDDGTPRDPAALARLRALPTGVVLAAVEDALDALRATARGPNDAQDGVAGDD